jgi:VWFA-related protein
MGEIRLKVNVDLVTVDVTVRGAPTRELQKDDFLIYDNGVTQQVIFLSRDQLPLSVALVIDRSPSIAPYLKELQSAALSALKSLKPGDQAALFTFDGNPARLTEFTQDFSEIAEKIGQITIGQATNISDSIFDAAQYLRERAPNRRRAIILVSDNFQTVIGAHTWNGALQKALEAGATLYSVEAGGDQGGRFAQPLKMSTPSPKKPAAKF